MEPIDNEWSLLSKIVAVFGALLLAFVVATFASKKRPKETEDIGDPVFPDRDIFGIEKETMDLSNNEIPPSFQLKRYYIVMIVFLIFIMLYISW